MKIVADKLRDIAAATADPGELDQFGRSAFNRYYYAAFLIVRARLLAMDAGWGKAAHKSLPDILSNRLCRQARQRVAAMKRAGALDDATGAQVLHSIHNSAGSLSQLLTNAYAARTVADYEPEERVFRDSGTLRLRNFTLKAAESWPSQAERAAAQMFLHWRKLGL